MYSNLKIKLIIKLIIANEFLIYYYSIGYEANPTHHGLSTKSNLEIFVILNTYITSITEILEIVEYI